MNTSGGEAGVPEGAGRAPQEEQPFRSSHTSNFADILNRLGISLMVSTYQAGKLIVVRADGDNVNTHFRTFQSPMGLALDPATQRLAIGERDSVWEFRNVPAAASKAEPSGKADALFVPRRSHHSGDIRIHEIAWIDGEIWAVNTRFSCLCTFDDDHSFAPRWRPNFVTALAPEDRCHLNGMAVVDGKPKYVTCLGKTDVADGWRENKANGGLLLDVDSGEIVSGGLSMPHSPRVYRGQQWILESGCGAISVVDPRSGSTTRVAMVPGFTRGLAFCGNLAFVGLSQVRESAIFGGIPLVEQFEERSCGVWAIDIRTGQTVAFLKFEGIVNEIFAVEVLHGVRFPDLVNEPGPLLSSTFVLPEEALRDVPL